MKDIISGTIKASEIATNDEFHLRSGKSYAILEVAKLFSKRIKFIKSRPGERFESAKNKYNNKAKRILNFNPKYNLLNYIEKFKRKLLKS